MQYGTKVKLNHARRRQCAADGHPQARMMLVNLYCGVCSIGLDRETRQPLTIKK